MSTEAKKGITTAADTNQLEETGFQNKSLKLAPSALAGIQSSGDKGEPIHIAYEDNVLIAYQDEEQSQTRTAGNFSQAQDYSRNKEDFQMNSQTN